MQANVSVPTLEPDFTDLFRRAAGIVDKILRGAKTSRCGKIRMAINLKTDKAFGLTVPPTLLALADEVIHLHLRQDPRGQTPDQTDDESGPLRAR